MKLILILTLILAQNAFAEAPCDIVMGTSVGVRVVEFATGNVVHSKMPLRDMSVASLKEEMGSLQELGICEEKIQRKKCVLKFEKRSQNQLTLIRDTDRWLSWSLKGKASAQKFVKILQQAGYCQ